MKLILRGERSWSWNKMYSGIHWAKRKEEADRIHQLVRIELRKAGYHQGVRPWMKNKVDIHTTVFFKNRPQDSDNICDKFYIDGLIGMIIEDDTLKFVRKTTTQSEIDQDNPRVEIEVTEVKG